MKLDEKTKGQIDSYFESISADELYNILISKYGFPVKANLIESLCDLTINNQVYDILEKESLQYITKITYSKYNSGESSYYKQDVEHIASEQNPDTYCKNNSLSLAA